MQDIIRHLPAVIFEYAIHLDGKEGFTYVSDQCEETIGLNSETLRTSASAFYAVVDHHERDFVKSTFASRSVTSKPYCIVVRLQVSNEIRKVEFTLSDEKSPDGVILRRGMMRLVAGPDSLTYDAAGEQETLLERLPIGVVIHHEGRVLFANAHAHNIIGAHTPGQLIGVRALDFVHQDYVSGITGRIKEVSEGGSVPMVEEKFVRLDGKVIDVETMAFPFVYRGKESIQVIFRDISDKKLTEARVRKNETLFTQLFQNVPMAVVMLDETGKVSEINKGFEQMFGFTKDDLESKNLNDYIVPEDLRSEGIDLNNLIASNQVVSIETIRKHRMGKLINVILCGVPVLLDHEAIGIYGVYIDITDRKKVEEELKVRNTELDNFVYKVSHDLRAPLSSILGLVNLSHLQGNTDDPFEYLRIIGEKVRALDHFIGDVLSHSKNLKMDVEISRVDLRKIIDQTFRDLLYLEGSDKTRKVVKIEGIDFYSDHWRISEIFRNLISNSIKYRNENLGESEISIKINIDHLCADISFADNGIGIKEANLKRIFEMFYRATSQGDGSGIGLYIVKNAVEKLGGEIKVASSPGQGTRFHIVLPNRINGIIDTSSISPEQT
jgi:PAS domain S-box-containing protein